MSTILESGTITTLAEVIIPGARGQVSSTNHRRPMRYAAQIPTECTAVVHGMSFQKNLVVGVVLEISSESPQALGANNGGNH